MERIISEYSKRFNGEIGGYFPMPEGPSGRVVEAMLYSMTNGGKRLRPFLVYETAKLFGADFDKSINTAMSLEMMHTYSLIHDDLPCMDDDDLRRGKPTCHKQFDEATAVLAGDGLLTYAFEVLCGEPKAARLIKLLSNAAGAFSGMIAGQMLDLLPLKEEEGNVVEAIEAMKTGRLISYACEAGAVLGDAGENEVKALIAYSRKIGAAFQIADDVLDVEGDPKLVGKTLNKDASQGKVTFVSLYGLEKAKEIAGQLIEEAKEALSIFGDGAEVLKKLADYMISRKY